jgi:CTP synthase
MGGTMRLGAYPAVLAPDTVTRAAYGTGRVSERHRHRYEVNNAYRDRLAEAGLVFSGTSPEGTLVEFVELPRSVHPFFVGTQAHPELKSRPTRAHPLFSAFIAAALRHDASSRLFGPDAEQPAVDGPEALDAEGPDVEGRDVDGAEGPDLEGTAAPADGRRVRQTASR